jgi:predicted DsbA family dithiol-disulfide isomerase
MNRALFKAFFQDGRDLADTGVLLEVGQSVGLDPEGLSKDLASGRFAPRVLDDEKMAREIDISGVPALIIAAGEQAYLVSGAQPYETLIGAITRAQQEGKAQS